MISPIINPPKDKYKVKNRQVHYKFLYKQRFMNFRLLFRLMEIRFIFQEIRMQHQNGKENLEQILLFLNENPSVSLQIIAHTDNEGENAYNQILSEKRAKSVCQFLESKGIDEKRLIPMGKGETEPKVENTNT